jgi:DNA-binding transcriptional regulator of glucitol operon
MRRHQPFAGFMSLCQRERAAAGADAVRFHLRDIHSVVTDKQVPGSQRQRNIARPAIDMAVLASRV